MAGRRLLLALPLLPGAAGAQPAPSAGAGTPGPPPPAPSPPNGLVALPGGGWRLRLTPEALEPTAAQRAALGEIGRRLAAGTTGRVTLWSEVSEGEDVSAPRRRALQRALSVRAALVEGGLPETRVDIRALGRTEAARDVVDVMPPGIARP